MLTLSKPARLTSQRPTSIGTVQVNTPIGSIVFHVVEADTPFLLSLRDLDKLGFYFNNLKNCLVSPSVSVPVVRRFGHPFLLWGDVASSFAVSVFTNSNQHNHESQLTDLELRQLHRRFGHPSARRLAAVLTRSSQAFSQKAIHELTQYCQFCQKHAKSPGRFKFALENDKLQFNYSVVIDIFYVDTVTKGAKSPVLHVIDEATRFQAAKFLKDVSAKHVWDILRACWIDMYVGPPDFIVHDAGTQFTSHEFTSSASAMAITTKCVPVEAHHSIGIVERYHKPLRRAYDIIREEIPDIQRDNALQMAVKAVNDTAGPDGLTPTLLVFGTYPRMVQSDPPSPSVLQRADAIKKAMHEVRKLHANRQVADALHQRNGPDITGVYNTPLGSDVLVWRENGGWKGPFQLFAIKD